MLAYEATLQNTLANLATFPAMGTEREDLAPGLRSFPVGSHLIVYRFGDNGIVVARNLHARMDLARLFQKRRRS